MKQIYRPSIEEAIKIREKMKTTKNKNAYRRLEAVALLGEGKTVKEVSEIVKYHEKYVRILGCKFCKQGLEVLATDGRKGGNHRQMTHEEAVAFLEQFKEIAENGQVITIEAIAAAFDEKTGITHKSLSTVYSFMHRNGWRKIMPRSRHPQKASDEAIEASKKLTLESKK